MFSPFKLGFQPTEKKKLDDAIFWLYGGCGVHLNREISNVSWVALAVGNLALSI
jgi:hypothetical protein